MEEIPIASAEVLSVFTVKGTKKLGGATRVAGCRITDGSLKRNLAVRILRDNKLMHSGILSSLKHGKDDVSELPKGSECGAGVEGFDDYQKGDVIQVIEKRTVRRILTPAGVQRIQVSE